MIPNIPNVPNMPPRTIGENIVYGKQAYTRSQDTNFWKFANVTSVSEAEKFINDKCGSKSLRDIDASPDAVAKWQALASEYQAWLDEQNSES